MKKRPVIWVMLGTLLALSLALGGCKTDDDGGGDNNDDPVFLGNTLELSGQVYLQGNTNTGVSYQKFIGDRPITDYYGGSGEIRNGNLAYSIGTPNELQAFNDYHYYDDTYNAGWGSLFDNYYDNVQASTDVRGMALTSLSVDSKYYGNLYKRNETLNIRDNSASGTSEVVRYVYVENDVTVSGSGTITTDTGEGYSFTTTTKNFNLALKAGWNAVYSKEEISVTFTGTINNPTSMNYTGTITMSLKNPSLRWVLQEYNDYSATLDRSSMLNAPEKGKLGLGGFEQRAKQATVK